MNIAVTSHKKYTIWFTGVSFLLFQFFLQLSSGVIITALNAELKLSSLAVGMLASAFYYVYTAMQIPVGLLFDRYCSRNLLALNVFFCALGCFIFSLSHCFLALFLGRFLMGAAASFAFIGLSHLLRRYFTLREFPFMMGLSETLGFSMTVLAMISMSSLLNIWGWRGFIQAAGCTGLLITALCLRYIPKEPKKIALKTEVFSELRSLLLNKAAWINGFFVGLVFSVITVFGALWAVPFVQLKIACTLNQATIISTMLLLGAGLSCPLFGKLSTFFSQRKPLMHASCFSTLLLLLTILFQPMQNAFYLGFLMFATGLCCGSYLLSYTIANELTPPQARSTATGFTNTLAMITAPLFQPLIGFFLDISKTGTTLTLENYQFALLVVPLAVLLGNLLVFFLPEKPAGDQLSVLKVADQEMENKQTI